MRATKLLTIATVLTMLVACDSASQARSGMTGGAVLIGLGAGATIGGLALPETPELAVAGAATQLVGLLVFAGTSVNSVRHLDEARGAAQAAGAVPNGDGQTGEAGMSAEDPAAVTDWPSAARALEASIDGNPPREVRPALRQCLEQNAEQCLWFGRVYQDGRQGTTASMTTACAAYEAGCMLSHDESCQARELNCAE